MYYMEYTRRSPGPKRLPIPGLMYIKALEFRGIKYSKGYVKLFST